ncbi:hypothetical protein GGR96_000120 [Thalassospira tepidiphila]|uniref:Uncharacterized protein n=1 Tax=Thalassospira tepidiphila TaxID=393657 RepID=A0ABX0WUP3_9PROT|nr:hypothetical protein [Thalassospira tepidiphila]
MKCAQIMRKGQAEYSSAEFTSDAEPKKISPVRRFFYKEVREG